MSTFASPAEGRVTSHWGPRERHPVTGMRGFHRGIDIAPPVPGQTGVPVRAAYAGTVRAVVTGRPPGDTRPNPVTGAWNTGNCVIVDGPGGGSEYYGHLATVVVAPGDRVSVGQVLGTMGRSGNVSGIHLHFECWDGRTQGGGLAQGNTRDPRVDFKRHGVTPGAAYVPPKTTPAPLPNPTREDWLDMDETRLRVILADELRKHANINNAAIHGAIIKERDAVLDRLATVGSLTARDVERIRVAILGDKHPKTPSTDLRGAVTTTMLEVLQIGPLVQSLAGAVAALDRGETFDVDTFLDGVEQRQRQVAAEFIGDLSADVTLTIAKEP